MIIKSDWHVHSEYSYDAKNSLETIAENTKVNAKCPNCGEQIVIDEVKDADICPRCNTAFVTEKAVKLYNQNTQTEKQPLTKKRRNVWKSFLSGLMLAVKCFFYLIYVVCLLWLFFDVLDDIKKK